MARKISMKQAINEALDQEMTRDPSVILMGEDIVGGAGGNGERDAWGGVLGVTKGLYAKHGDRLLDTPLSESAYVGAAIGAAACGMRPVAELMFIDFMGVCFDQIYNQAAKFKYMFGGKAQTPVVIRTMVGAGFRADAHAAVHAHPRAEGGVPEHAVRHQGPADPGHPRQRPGDLLRAQEPLWLRRRGARGELHDPVRGSERRA
jgi:pyruvate/2-oxoglutarate/acetoin dehydrogenase E1 component